MIRSFTGYHMTAILIVFFATVVGVNVTMALFAARTFGGTVVDNSYVASQEFNDWLARSRSQNAAGWLASTTVDGTRRVTVTISCKGRAVIGAALDGYAEHPLGYAADIPLRFVETDAGHYRAAVGLPKGRWRIHLSLRAGGADASFLEEVV